MARSDEHVVPLEGGRVTKSGAPIRAAGGYTLNPTGMEWGSAVAFYGPGAVHEGRDIVQMKVLSDRRGEGGGIAWLVRYSVHGHVGRPEYPHAVVASRIPSLVPPRAPDPGDLSRGAIHRLASEMCLINKEETVYA